MNISELIAELAAIQAEHGDIETFTSGPNDLPDEITGVRLNTSEDGSVSVWIE